MGVGLVVLVVFWWTMGVWAREGGQVLGVEGVSAVVAVVWWEGWLL